MLETESSQFTFRNVRIADIKQVYKLLVANRPYVGLNSRYTYFLLAKDFYDTCLVVEKDKVIVGFSSGYVPPNRQDTFFNWEIVVHQDFRGNCLQKLMLLHQIKMKGVRYLEATVNPSNETCKKNFVELAQLLGTAYKESVLFSEEDFEGDGHETEVLIRIGPISQARVEKLVKDGSNKWSILNLTSEEYIRFLS
jgi:L-2,4-diaminobutyric acid acetyltransferase